MLHWPEVPSSCPNKWATICDAWRALELAYDDGLVRSIGVSNFEVEHLERLMEECSVVPHVNQIEYHPFQNPVELRSYCEYANIQVQGYCPLGKGKILNHPDVVRVAKNLRRTPAQVLIRWSLEQRVATVPKSTKLDRVLENVDVFDFELSTSDLKILNSLHDGRHYVSRHDIQSKIDSNLPDGYKLYL